MNFMLATDCISPDALVLQARRTGVTALGVSPPVDLPDWTTKVLLASLVDVADPVVQRTLVSLNMLGRITLTRVDFECLVPLDRIELYQASRFRHMGARFDCLQLNNRLLYFSMVR